MPRISIPMEAVEEITYLRGGWVRYLRRGAPYSTFVRFAEVPTGHLSVASLHVVNLDDGGGLSAEQLRRIPLGQIEALVRVDPEPVMVRIHLPVDLDTLLGDPGSPDDLGEGEAAVIDDARSEVPSRRPYPDDFYRGVAERYRSLVGRVRNPVGLLADAYGVELTTAQRWVRQARLKGFLPPASHGKAG